MSEPFFGSVSSSPMWPGTQFPLFGLPQTLAGIGSRPLGISSEGFAAPQIPQVSGGVPTPLAAPPVTYGFTSPPYGMATVPQTSILGQPGQGFTLGASVPGVFVQPSGFAGPGGYEVPVVTAPALLGAVAFRRGQPFGPTNDREIEEFIYDALELLPAANDIEVRSDGGRVTLTGTVQHKRLKRDVGEIAWAMSSVNDVVNNVNIAARRRSRAPEREQEAQPGTLGKKPA